MSIEQNQSRIAMRLASSMDNSASTKMNLNPEDLLSELQAQWSQYKLEEDISKKEEALKILFYKFQFAELDVASDEQTATTCFVGSILEDICSFLLERVYDIISKSHLFNTAFDCGETPELAQNVDSLQFFKEKHIFTELILSAPSDCSKIVALRTFLTHELGHHIFHFLRRIDFKLMASQSSICSLCINLFPNCQWDDIEVQLNSSNTIREFVESIILHQRLKVIRSQDFTHSSELKSTLNESIKHSNDFHKYDLEEFMQLTRTSDEIAANLIDLLDKCVDIETDFILNDQSTSIVCWRFAVEKLATSREAFGCEMNEGILKCKLLRLLGNCLNHICWQGENFATLNLKETINKLLKALHVTADPQIIFGIIYLIFGLVNNVIALSNGRLHDELKFINEEDLDKCISKLRSLFENPSELEPLFASIIKVLIKIVDNLNKTPPNKSRKVRNKLKGHFQQHCRQTNLSCFFQKILLNIMESLPGDLQNYLLRYFQRYGFCCCLCNTETIKILFSKQIKIENRKLGFGVAQRKVLTTVLTRNNCTSCEFKLKSVEFHKEILGLYLKIYMGAGDFDEYNCLLKHLKHISHLVSYDISTGILANIVLPIFRTYKHHLVPGSSNNHILVECLSIFITYLSDVRLIKAFYIEENIKHLEDLMHRPELTRSVCDLIKVGIENSAFLGDNCQEQAKLSKRLISLQLNGSVKATRWFNGMLKRLKHDEMIGLDEENECKHNKEMSALQILHIASRHWCLNYQLIKSTQHFQSEFINQFTNSDLISLLCNTLSCFLIYCKKEEITPLQSQEIQTPHEESIPLNSFLSSLSSAQTSMTTSELQSFDDVTQFYSNIDGKGFLQTLKEKDMDESIVLFDIKNQIMPYVCDKTSDDPLLLSMQNSTSSDDQKSLFGRIFGFIFGPRSNSTNNLKENKRREQIIDEDLQCLFEAGDCKKLLLKLFESIMAVYVRENKTNITEAMQKNLRKLKAIILSRATQDWNQDDTSTTAVTLALQSLLRIAELTGSFVNEETLTNANRDDGNANTSAACGVDEPTMVSTESEGDYYSTRASLICADSEVDFSENETEEFYLTADEGYEADGEIPGISETEDEIDELWTPYTPTSRYRTHVVHSGICRIVIEILADLSVKCAENPSVAWASSLAQLAARLFVIRELLGGPLFLLQGFAPVLQNHDVNLRELQKAILDLVVDLNSPEVLSTFFSILASKNPPVDILIEYMSYICSSTMKKRPTVELEFPMLNDGKCISSSDPLIAEQIERVRNYHLYNHANTPFIRSACILPITQAKLWGADGLTISIWLQIKSNMHHKSCSQIIDDESKNSSDYSLRTHLLSVGSNQAMFSIYVNGNMNLVLETSKPNAELSPRTPTNEDTIHSNKENIPSNLSPPSGASPFRNALKHTKLAILNSFNHMHLFNGHGVTDGYFEGSSIELKYFRLCKAKWTHLCFAIDLGSDRVNLTLIADGLEEHTISLPFRNVRNLTRTSTFQLLSLGDSLPKANCNESRSTLDGVLGSPLKFSISNVILFNRKIADKGIVQNLTAMGPDFIDLTQCQVGGWKPNVAYLNLNKSFNAKVGNFHEAMKVLRDSRFFTFSATEPSTTMCFDHTMDGETNCGKNFGIILYGSLNRNVLHSVQTSTVLCGGLSTLLYQFARVVELTFDSTTQSAALNLLLSVALSDTQLYTEFLRNDYISLIGYVIKTDRCTKDTNLLASIVNNACTQHVIVKRSSVLQVDENSIACLAHPILITSVLHRYADWHRSACESSEVLETLFKVILALVRDKHPCKEFNMKQLNRVGLIKELLNLCKVYVVEALNPVHISTDAADSFVNILSVFAGSPPSASLMDEIMKLLLLLHKPSECFITHDRSKFFFLLSSESPIKEKGLGLQLPRKIFRDRKRSSSTSLLRATQYRRNTVHEDLPNENSPKFRRMDQKNDVNNLMNDPAGLESIADCSRLTKQSLRVLSPQDAGKWRLKMKRHSVHHIGHSSPKNYPQKSIHKRVRTVSKSSIEADKKSRSNRNSNGSLESPLEDNQGTAQANESIKWPMGNTFFTQKKSRTLFKPDFYNSPGIMKLQEKLFVLLKNFLWLLPDTVVEEVLTHYVKMDILLVLSNHISPTVRTAILKLLSALSKRISSNELGNFTKKFYPQHLANQLSIYPTDVHMIETCLEWVTGLYGCLDAFATYECISIPNRFGLNALFSILTQTAVQADYTAKAFNVLRTIYLTDLDNNYNLIETGLLHCCMKALHNMYQKTTQPNLKTEEAITELLTLVGERALKSVGQMNTIWDIINMLSYYQNHNPVNVVKGFRSVQGKLQLNWLDIFFKNRTSNLNIKIIALPNSSLTLSETKTRLDLLIDRCSQFFTTFGPTYVPSENELKLFELLVTFGISANTRCNNFIAWGLLSSRPLELRQFIIDTLWLACQNEVLPTVICDGKMIKTLLWLCLLEQKANYDNRIENLEQLCSRLGIRDTDMTWNLEQELDRIELNRHNISAKQKSMLEKTIYKFEPLAASCIESSMIITRVVAELQNSERKALMNHMKEYDENYTFHKWLEIIRRMTHEGAPWFSNDRSETSFELDDTEGPSRVHTRLRRCHLDIDKRFIMEDYRANALRRDEYVRPLDYLISCYDQQLNISLNSQILYNFPAKYLPVDAEIDGEIIVTDHKLYFIATYRCKYFYVSCDVANITEIWLKRYRHQEKAFEIFLDTNKSLFFSLQNQDDWKIMKEVFLDKIVVCPDQSKILLITQQWREGLLTNWEYIMTLNQIAGRTYNDLMQYPVFPWILANYTSDLLDLTDRINFRKLEKPIAVQHQENEQHYVNNYMYINNTMTNMGTIHLKPYHYSSHYSNSGTVLHFLVRVPPFTSYFLRYQDNNFDLPDRTFHALSTTWSLASKDSPTDVKELIPEFFCLPEIFENFERFDFGCRQSGERVEDVLLPPWCSRDPRLFVLIHRQALESEIVRLNVHHWIDLIFGHNQTGQNAVDAINVFHPATYAVFLESEITDPIERNAVETMIKTYGQMPKQLFKAAHPSSKALNYCLGGREVIPTVKGLRWGVFLGSPQLSTPTLGNIYKLSGADFLVSFNNTNMIYGLPAQSCVMQGPESDTFNVISWGYDDRIVRIQPLSETQAKPKALLYNNAFDDITYCGSDPNSNLLWCGHKSGRISVYKCSSLDPTRIAKSRQSYVKGIKLSYNSAFRKITPKSSLKMEDLEQTEDMQKTGAELTWSGPTILIRHTDEITSICLSVEFKISVSAGRDGIAVIWDLNDLSYIRTIERPAEIHHSPITIVTISPTLGDIVTVHSIPKNDSESTSAPVQADECFEVTEESLDDFVNVSINPNGKSILRLHSVNARYVSHIVHEDRILAVCYSYIKEGVGVNVIATAVEGGIVRLWSSWNLSFVTEIVTGISNIKSLTYSTHQHLVVLTKDCNIQVWEAEGLYGNPPKFPQIVFK